VLPLGLAYVAAAADSQGHTVKMLNLKITWRCILYPWKVDDALAEKMAKAGCERLSIPGWRPDHIG
jgi:hypothetical protein